VNEAPGSSPHFAWLVLVLVLLVAYRALVVAALAAFQALPSIQRRMLLEESAFGDGPLGRLLERPQTLGMGLGFWSLLLLMAVLGLGWTICRTLPWGLGILMALSLGYLWVFDVAFPYLLTSRDPGTWLRRLFPWYAPFHGPMALLVSAIAARVEREETESRREAEDQEVSEDAVTALLEEGEAEGILEAEDRELIRNVVSFGDTLVREVMTPRTRILALPVDATQAQAWEAFRESRHSRLPVYEGTLDRVVGVLLLKDLMQHPEQPAKPIGDLLKQPFFVPESKPVQDLLREMQRRRTQLAVVVDEFGGMSGVVTVEDLLEEVFGEIRDEHETPAEIVETSPGVFEVSGQVHVEDFAERFGLTLEREGFDTVGGLVMAQLGRVPAAGDELDLSALRLKVLQMDGARVLLVRVQVR
jgi:CBS domain containing-hemolysin-like protein